MAASKHSRTRLTRLLAQLVAARRLGRWLDPYLIWAEWTDFRGFGTSVKKERRYQMAAELEADLPPTARGWLRRLGFQVDPKADARYASALLGPREWKQVRCSPLVKRFELGLPLATGDNFLALKTRGRPPNTPRLQGLVIAVIDDACAFAHESFRFSAQGRWISRIAYLWDQGAGKRKDPWRTPADFGYGQELGLVWSKILPHVKDPAHVLSPITDLIQRNTGGQRQVDESACYRDCQYDSVVASAFSHGTHVLDLAAGSPNPLHRLNLGPAHDAAAEAGIIFVQLPRNAVADTSGGSMCVFVIDALRYIMNRVDPEAAQVVVNLSYGSIAGSHDGGSILERAIDEVCKERDNLAVVLPAGNFYRQACHARVVLSVDKPRAPLRVQVRADDPSDTFVELWWHPMTLPPPVLRIVVKPPGGAAASTPVEEGDLLGWDGTRWSLRLLDPLCAIIRYAPTAGTDMPSNMALIALAPTRSVNGDRKTAPAGIWTITIELAAGSTVAVDAWIERDDRAIAAGRSRSQAFFLSDTDAADPAESGSPVVRSGTLNSIAHGEHTIVAGACVHVADFASEYTSAGPGRHGTRRIGPDLVAPSDESRALKGLQAAGNRSASPQRMHGTSVAAPVVARRIANLLAAHQKAGKPPLKSSDLELRELLLKRVTPDLPTQPPDDLETRRGHGHLDPDPS